MIPTSQAEEQLVLALQQRGAAGFAQLYKAYAPVLYKVLLKLVNDPDCAEDLLQDTFVKIWSNSHRYNPGQGSLFAWLLTIARRIGLSELRDQRMRQTAGEYMSDGAALTKPVGYAENILHQSLKPKYRAVLELIYYQDYTYQEAADALALPLGTVKTRTRKGLEALRLLFSQDIAYYRAGCRV